MVKGLQEFIMCLQTELNRTRRLWRDRPPTQWVAEWIEQAEALLIYSRKILERAAEKAALTEVEITLIDEKIDALNACFPAEEV